MLPLSFFGLHYKTGSDGVYILMITDVQIIGLCVSVSDH